MTDASRLKLAALFVFLWSLAALAGRAFGPWLALGSIAIVLGIATLVALRPTVVPLLRPTLASAGIGLLAGAAMVAATDALYFLAARFEPALTHDVGSLYRAYESRSPVVGLILLLPVILGEELVWRGVVQTSVETRWGAWPGVALAAALYGVVQLPLGSPALVMAALACGAVWSGLRHLTRGLTAPILAHLVWDVVVLVLFPLPHA